jgi:putative addiction module component (TIGR02574 family)
MTARRPITVADVADMSVPERMQLVEDIWDSIAADSKRENMPLRRAQKAELGRRLRSLRRNPEAGIPWEVAKAMIRSKRR